MGTKYMALCYTYPYNGIAEYEVQSNYFIPFLIKIIRAVRKYEIIDIKYRNC